MDYARWGSDIDDAALEQMRHACSLPISRAAALMPDAHVGYGLPIGGVLATENAVIPYAVGVDIACRVMLSVYDLDPAELTTRRDHFAGILERNTLFGVGKEWREPPDHAVMDADWNASPFTRGLKDLAHRQLGTSGSGNHFVEFGIFERLSAEPPTTAAPDVGRAEPGRGFLAVVSHSGSRGPGGRTAEHYSRMARELQPDLPKHQSHLAWLPLGPGSNGSGEEYWAAMELMGQFASANHHIIHGKIARSLGREPVLQVENHHNFAWRERHDINGADREVIVHRKGATPAARGQVGYIPGSMTAPGYLIVGQGEPRTRQRLARRGAATLAHQGQSQHPLGTAARDPPREGRGPSCRRA